MSRKWVFDERSSSSSAPASSSSSSSSSSTQLLVQSERADRALPTKDVVPYGYVSAATLAAAAKKAHDDESDVAKKKKRPDPDALVYQSAMNVAQAPGKALFMTAFMLWMSGNALQIFSIMMLAMSLQKPIQGLMSVHTAFQRYDDSGVDITLPKIVFCLCHIAGFALALYKCNNMGLLPTATTDWMATPLVREAVQMSVGRVM